MVRIVRASAAAAFTAIISVTVLAGGATAQPAGSEVVDTITVTSRYGVREAVTGTKSTVPILEVPQSIAVVGESLIAERNLTTLSDTLYNVSGVSDVGARRGFDNIVIRGFTASSSVYLDGLRVERGNWNVAQEPFALERVEVLKGPGSVLFGQGSLGGIVNQVSKTPAATPALRLALSAGRFGSRSAALDATGALNDSARITGRVTLLYRDQEDSIDFTQQQRLHLSPTLQWANDSTRFTLRGNVTRDRHDGSYVGLPPEGTFMENPNGRLPRSLYIGEPDHDRVDADRYQIGYQLEHTLGPVWRLRHNLRHTDSDVLSNATFASALADDQRMLTRGSASFAQVDESTVMDTHFEAGFEGGRVSHTLLLGVDLMAQRVDSTFDFGSFPALDLFEPEYGGAPGPFFPILDFRRGDDLHAVYAQNLIRIGDRTSLLMGLRYDVSQARNLNRLNDSARTQRDRDLTTRVGVSHELTPGLALFAGYAEAFNPNFGLDPDGRPFEAETGTQYEAGIKTDLADGRVRTTFAAYELTRDNVLVPFPGFPGVSIQTGRQRSRGLESDVAVSFADRWNLTAAYAYTDVSIVRDANAALIGSRPVSVPRHQLSAWLSHDISTGRGLLRLGFGGRHVTRREGALPNSYRLPDYQLLDAALIYRQSRWEMQLNIDNLTNKRYVASASPTGTRTVLLGEPLTTTATIRYRL